MSIDEQAEREGTAINRAFRSSRPKRGSNSHTQLINSGTKEARHRHKEQLKLAFRQRPIDINENASPAMIAYLNGTHTPTFEFR